MVGKFGITASLSIVYVYSAEVFPTVIRQSGIGMGSMCARAGGVLAPIIYLLRGVSKNAPMVLFGLCTLLGATLTLLLPETAHQPLADTIEDVEGSSIRSESHLYPLKGKTVRRFYYIVFQLKPGVNILAWVNSHFNLSDCTITVITVLNWGYL
uniref:Si:dkey-119m7.8 n=1 Tax=Hucho hucho TaxID=62062 RepID=A0A4W5N9E9_9TELE